ncbi:hypothetical protein [Micromonospora sp. MW-13]|uniref:hypothetical protein n=1 Tax=Micromonospora sp. MW-13 TaxID=2094022 RepID=UPI001FB2AF31|nr:hypothetical protein [Micromonospora sp. MW-13]
MSDERGGPAGPPRCGPTPTRLGVTEPRPDDPLAVVAAGPAGAARRDVLAALLGVAPGTLAVPPGSWLRVGHARVPTRAAYVPGYRQPHAYAPDQSAAGPALARPPRRVELTVAEPLLRHFTVFDTPDTDTLGVAGGRVLLDAVGRAGALLFVIAADQAFTAAELHLLAEAAHAAVEVFFVVTPGVSGWAPPPVEPPGAGSGRPDGPRARGRAPRSRRDPARTDGTGASVPTGPSGRAGRPPTRSAQPGGPVDPWPARSPAEPGLVDAANPVEVVLAAHRAVLLAAVPALAAAPWYPARPDDVGGLRRALVGWAADEGLRRASAQPPVLPGAHGRVPVSPDADATGWAERLDRQARSCAQRIRQHLALELANTHLRVVQEIVFGVGCAGLPQLLDRELEALSLLATVQCDAAVRALLDDAAGRVLGDPVPEGVRRRIGNAVRWGLADHPAGRGLDRVLLVTSTAGVAELAGAGAVDAVSGYPAGQRVEVLPPVAVALAGGCWQHWRSPGNEDPGGARSWAQRALREVELELTRDVSRRFEAVRRSLGAVLSDAIDHGILLA